MKTLRESVDPDAYFALLARAKTRVLFLDYDGTLAPFRVERDRAFPYPEIPPLLDSIHETGTRIIIVSGREVDALLPLLRTKASFEIWGAHAWERRRANGDRERFEPAPPEGAALEEAWAWVRERELQPRCERKIASIALHWRGMASSEAEALAARARESWGGIARASGLELIDMAAGIEIRSGERNKGDAVRTVLTEHVSSSIGDPIACAYVGDDMTDEDAFFAVRGIGLSVLVGEEPRPSAADILLRPPGELFAFLERWRSVCRA
ncbi:MAG: trehalose-phosphatase [Gemmatimonadetes bacterium]|nr:trehalose-phosphatase [Gemmatimonadota bacterium]